MGGLASPSRTIMGGAAKLSGLIKLTHRPSSLSPFANFSFPRHHHCAHQKKPIVSICQSQPSASNGEEAEDIHGAFFGGDYVVEDESDEEDTESSVDLLIRFLQSMFKKVSKRAKKASRSVLPAVIPPQLVSFAVDGILLLGSLSIVKALLEVFCTLGGTVFVVILLLRLIWATVSYIQSSGSSFSQSGGSYGTT